MISIADITLDITKNFTISLENPAIPYKVSEIRSISYSTPPDMGKPDYRRKHT